MNKAEGDENWSEQEDKFKQTLANMKDDDIMFSAGKKEELLGNYLDEMCILKLDYGLHLNAGVTTQIFGEDFFLN